MNAEKMERSDLSNLSFTAKIQRQFYTLFYQYLFGRETSISRQLTKLVHYLEVRQQRSDVPMARDIWETQYQSGRWDYMAEMEELARYSPIISYMAYLKSGGAFLDVGCGEGILFERFRPYGYSKFVGFDISEVAISKMLEKQDEITAFIRAEAETFTTDDHFDLIIYNQALCHLHDPLQIVERY